MFQTIYVIDPDIQFGSQEHAVKVALPVEPITAATTADWVERFHTEHARKFSFRLDVQVEIVNFHLVGNGLVRAPGLPRLPEAPSGEEPPEVGRRETDFDQFGVHPTKIYDRDRLAAGHVLVGPVVVEEPATTVVIPPGWQTRVDSLGNLRVTQVNQAQRMMKAA